MEDKIIKELKSRIKILLIVFFILFLISIYISKILIKIIVEKLSLLNIELISISPLESLLLILQSALIISIGLIFPFFLYQALKFITPALTKMEKKPLYLLLFSSLILFFAGISFSYILNIRIIIPYLQNLSQIVSITNRWSAEMFIKFLLLNGVIFGLVFQIPLLIIGLVKMNIINVDMLKKYRKHIIIINLILAALITPPDIFSQVIVVIPITALFELSLVFSRFVKNKDENKIVDVYQQL